MLERILQFLTVCSLCAFQPTNGAAQQSSSSKLDVVEKKLDEANEQLIATLRKALFDFRNESRPTCDSMNLGKSSGHLLYLVKLVEGGHIKLSLKHYSDLVAIIEDITDAAQKAGCEKETRVLAAIRQRIEIGVRDRRPR